MKYNFDIQGHEPARILNQITQIQVRYIDFDNNTKVGNIVCNIEIANDLINIFSKLYDIKFPIFNIEPISVYKWNDEVSALANNTSCFNYRNVEGTDILSVHSVGFAIDINPLQNPWIHPMIGNLPPGSIYDVNAKGVITDEVVKLFKNAGFKWGGDWNDPDYMHFHI